MSERNEPLDAMIPDTAADGAPHGSAPNPSGVTPIAEPATTAEPPDVAGMQPGHAVTRELGLFGGRSGTIRLSHDTVPLSHPTVRLTAMSARPLSRLAATVRREAALIAILIVAAALRIYDFNWDEGTDLHPDERGIVGNIRGIGLPHSWAEFWSPSSPLNPHFDAYGHLPLYATALFGHILGWLGRTIGGPLSGLAQMDITDAGIIHSGRILSGIADTGTILFVYLIGRMVFGRSVGLLAALLGTFTVLDLEFSHFANVDTFLACCAMGALYFCVRIVRHGRAGDYAWAGAWIGFALACKVSAAPLIVPLVVAHIYRGAGLGLKVPRQGPWTKVRGSSTHEAPLPSSLTTHHSSLTTQGEGLPSNPLLLLLSAGTCLVAVFATMPYAFIDFSNWWGGVWYQLQLAQGSAEQPFTRKFSGLPAYWYPLQQLIGWSLGLPLGLSAVAGVVAALVRQVRRRRPAELVLLAWAAVFFVATAGQYMKFLRYMMPLAPVLELFAAALLVAAWRWGGTRVGRASFVRSAMRPAVLVVVALSILYGLAYENIYTSENTRLAATRWMAAHVPANATITTEDWDETLPFALAGVNVPPYRATQLSILGPGDSAATVAQFVNATQTDQYVTIASARDFGSVAHQPWRYPYSIRWYDLLFSNRLNFKLVKSFTDPPHLGPFSIDDYQAPPQAGYYDHVHLWYGADQNLSEYNSPPVYIFERTGSISPARAQALLTHNDSGHPLAPATVAYDPSHTMLLPQKVEQADQKAPTYDTIFPANNPLARVPILSWLVMIELLGLLALPLVMRACHGRLRDGGYGLTKLCGIVIVGYLTWMAASLHVAVYSRGLILAACALLLALSLAVGLRPRALWAELRVHRKGVVLGELVFLAAFLVWTGVRMAYPDLWHIVWGGERSQELSFMNAILRSQYFPPQDPWFAGGTLNYYYYGQYLTGMLMRLVGIPVPIAFNLALPTLFALVLSISFCIGYSASGRAWVGGAAVALEGVLGNLGPVQQFAALAPTHASSFLPLVGGIRDAFSGLIAVLTHQAQLPSDFFWTSSRILSVNGDAINEYPIWSFTYGDMHAHVIDMPILLGVVALALAISGFGRVVSDEWRVASGEIVGRFPGSAATQRVPRAAIGSPLGRQSQARAPDTAMPLVYHETAVSGPQLALLVALMAVVAGATGPTNLWDLPTALAILVAGFGLRGWFEAGRRGWAVVLRDVVVPGAVLGALCLLLYRPFYTTVLGISSGFTFLTPSTPTDQYLLHLGLPLFLLASFVYLVLRPRVGRLATVLKFRLYYWDKDERFARAVRLVPAMVGSRAGAPGLPTLLSAHVALFGALLALIVWSAGWTTLALIVALLTLTSMALIEVCVRTNRDALRDGQPFALVLALFGLALTAIPDVVMQNEAGRMNTFFKLYNQAWPMLALSGALGLGAIVRARRAAPSPALARSRQQAPQPGRPRPALASAIVARPLALQVSPSSAGGPSQAWSAQAPAAGAGTGEPPRHDGATDRDAQQGAITHDLSLGAPRSAQAPAAGASTGRFLWWIALAGLVGGAALFPIFGTVSHLQLRQSWPQVAAARIPTGLDGAAFVRVLYPADWEAIQWINSHIRGMPVLLTSDRGGYRDFATKVTMFTGLPTVVSWPGEDMQERYAGQGRQASQYPSAWVNQFESGRVTWNGSRWVMNLPAAGAPPAAATRSTDVETIYNTPDPAVALPLLKEYHVSYIYVGTAERGDPDSDELQGYGRVGFAPAGLAKFGRMVAAGELSVAYNHLGVTIYRVNIT